MQDELRKIAQRSNGLILFLSNVASRLYIVWRMKQTNSFKKFYFSVLLILDQAKKMYGKNWLWKKQKIKLKDKKTRMRQKNNERGFEGGEERMRLVHVQQEKQEARQTTRFISFISLCLIFCFTNYFFSQIKK